MPSITIAVEDDVATRQDGIAAGAGPHLPVGYWSGQRYRSAVRFNPPAGWDDWTAVTKATLSFYISDHQHVGVRNSSIYVKRAVIAEPWTNGPGSQSCNDGFSAGNTTQWDDLVPSANDQVSFSSGSTANAKKTVTVTAAVQEYWANSVSKMTFIFDAVGSSDYTELWSEATSKEASLTIEYTVQSVPNAPSLTAPAAGATIEDQTPNFSWVHSDPQSDPQTAAQVELYQNDGTTLINTYTVTGAANNIDGTDTLTRGLSYKWRVRTSDAGGYGAWTALRTFTVRAEPVVVVSSTRRMTFTGGAPRLAVGWTVDQPQTHYRVQSSAGYDSGWVAGSDVYHVLSTQAVVDGVAQTITVSSRSSYGALEGSDSESFTPRYGLTTHRKDLTSAPTNWGTPVIVSTVPTDAALVIEYGSDVAAISAPSVWYPALSSVPKKRYLFWRAWFIPSASAGPELDSITIPADGAVTLCDKWGTTRDVASLAAPWSIDPGEAVYGTRSMTVDCNGSAQKVYSFAIKVRANRSYILTGLMKSEGNSGAHFRLEKPDGTILTGGGMVVPEGPVQSDVIDETRDWFEATTRDVHRYRTPVYEAEADMTVYVVLGAEGVSGAKAWWDAVKLEESTVATPWSPGAIGATVVDAGGVQIDGSRGGVFRYKGTSGGSRATVTGGTDGLLFAGDTELTSPSDGVLAIDGATILTGSATGPIRRVYGASTTWTKPAGLHHIEVEVVGGGGGGGAGQGAATGSSAGGGGAGGGYCKKVFLAAALPSSCTVTVGPGGAGGTGAANGTGGTASSFAGSGITTMTANGGGAGTGMASATGNANAGGGVGGTATGGDINVQGGSGGTGTVIGGTRAYTGFGGGSVYAGTARQASTLAQAAGGYGGGGAGGNATTTPSVDGGAGSTGVVIVTEYY